MENEQAEDWGEEEDELGIVFDWEPIEEDEEQRRKNKKRLEQIEKWQEIQRGLGKDIHDIHDVWPSPDDYWWQRQFIV